MLKAAGNSGLTIGVGGGGSAGAIGFLSGGAQVVADPRGNIGVAFSFGGSIAIGVGYLAGGQVSASNASSIFDLRGPSSDYGVSAGLSYGAGLDYGVAGSVKTGTGTLGVAGGGKVAVGVGGVKTVVPNLLSTNCR